MRTMFGVMDTTHIFTDAERFPYADAPTGSRFDYVQRDEVWYRIYFLESNARTRGALIAASEGTVYDAEARGSLWERVARDFERDFRLDLGDDTNLERVLARRAALIRSAYLDVSGVSERAKALAEEITADCGSDYEKVRAIAVYLQGHYRYTVLPEPVPEGEDFLDWLLFESREGYCAWYATAATLLSRSVGVPARYVQGYRGELDGEVFTPLDPADAHAWCECYIGGYGWVTVEATPGFGSDGDGWLTAAEEEALHGSAADPAAAPEERPRGETDGILLPGQSAPAEQEAVSEESAGKTDDARSRFNWLPIPIAAAGPALLLALRLRRRRRRKKRSEAADGATRLRIDLEQLLRDLRGKGYPRRPEESLQQYFARLPWHYLLASEDEAGEMAALYDRTFFGLKEPSEEELERHRAFAARFRPKTLRQRIIWYGLQ